MLFSVKWGLGILRSQNEIFVAAIIVKLLSQSVSQSVCLRCRSRRWMDCRSYYSSPARDSPSRCSWCRGNWEKRRKRIYIGLGSLLPITLMIIARNCPASLSFSLPKLRFFLTFCLAGGATVNILIQRVSSKKWGPARMYIVAWIIITLKAHLNGKKSVKIFSNCFTIFQKLYLVYLNFTNSVKSLNLFFDSWW